MKCRKIAKLASTVALSFAASAAFAAPYSFTLEWDLDNTIDSNGQPFDEAHSAGYWGNPSWEGATATKLWWGDPSYLELTEADNGIRLTHYNSSAPETTGRRTVALTQLLLSFNLYGTQYDDVFAVLFNETPNPTPGDDIFTIDSFAFSGDFLGGDGYIYHVTFLSDTPEAADGVTYKDFNAGGQFSTPENAYSYLHFTLDVVRATSDVPEPGVLALLGIGLFGWGVSRRRA